MFVSSIKKSKRDISNLKFCSKIIIARVLRKANILLCFRNRTDQINFYNFLNSRFHFRSLRSIWQWVSTFPEFTYPIIKCTRMNTALFTPLVIGQSTLAAFHDSFIWSSLQIRLCIMMGLLLKIEWSASILAFPTNHYRMNIHWMPSTLKLGTYAFGACLPAIIVYKHWCFVNA